MRNLVIFVPDIFRPLQLKNQMALSDMPDIPAISQLMSQAQRSHFNASNCIDTLFRLFDIDVQAHQTYPVAALTYLVEVEDPADDWCLRIDPVHLQIDRDHLILSDNHWLKMKDKEAFELIATINQLYEDEGITIEPGTAGHWYIRLDADPELRTHPINDVIGKNIEPYLMSGERRQYWQSIMNEIQMLLHEHKVNQKRERDGLLPVNSVWLWGEGRLTDFRSNNEAGLWQHIYSNNNLCVGLAKLTGLPVANIPASLGSCLNADNEGDQPSEKRTLVMLGESYTCIKYGEWDLWHNFLQDFENKWARPIVDALKAGHLDSVEIYEGNGRRYLITPQLLKRWWRRTRPLLQSI